MSLTLKQCGLVGIKAPRVLVVASELFGTREIVGPKHNKVILAWADTVGIGSIVNDDEQAWCGLFVAYVLHLAGKENPLQSWDKLRAKKYLNVGQRADKAVRGDILVFDRDGGGHVGFYVGEDADDYFVLGGNQGNCVSIVPIKKSRLTDGGIRRLKYNVMPAECVSWLIDAAGAVASTNEA